MAGGFPGDFLYLDESGDLGLGADSSPIFVVGILHLKSASALSRVIKRARKKVLGRKALLNELKWSSSSEAVKSAVIAQTCRESCHIAGLSAVAIEKAWINTLHSQRKADTRYNYAVRIALEKGGLFDQDLQGRNIRLTIDARNRRATETLQEYIGLLQNNGEIGCGVDVVAGNSLQVAQLQVTDFMVGSVYAAYAHGQWRYLNELRKAGIVVKIRILRPKK